MRFLLVSAQYLPTVGGVERYTHSLARTLAGQGHAVTVATSARPGLPAVETDENGVTVRRLPAIPAMKGRFPLPRFGGGFRAEAGALWAEGFDFALINSRFYPLALWAAGQCRRRGVPAIILDHSTGHMGMGSAFLNFFGGLYEHAAMAWLKRRCPHFYGVSRACADWLAHFGAAAEGVLYNAVDMEQLEGMAAGAPALCERLGIDAGAPALCERLGIDAGALVVVFSGRFIPEKGVYELLEAFAALRRDRAEALLVMAGEGPELEPVRAAAGEGVLVTGPLPYADNIALLARADVFCLPTRYAEGFPTIVLEAAALGRCVVTTPAGGSPELISDGKSGILLKDPSPGAIAGALARLAGDAPARQAMGAAARAEVERRFTWRATAAALVQIAERMGEA